MKYLCLLALILIFGQATYSADIQDIDKNTLSNYQDVKVQHYDFSIDLDFENKSLTGTVNLQLFGLVEELNQFVLDISDILIVKVEFESTKHDITRKTWLDWSHVLCESEFCQGDSLVINTSNIWTPGGAQVGTPIPQHENCNFIITYEAAPSSIKQRNGYSFVDKEHTLGGEYPMFYTQNEPIFMRSWIPFQDTPMVKSDWTGTITVPKDLEVYMSGTRDEDASGVVGNNNIVVYNSHHHLTPGYYIGLVVGKLNLYPISDRVNLICEEEISEEGQQEMQEVESWIENIEEFIGVPYFWDSFSVVLMPPNYPYEGGAHPQLTYLSPSVLQSKQTGYSVILHMIANSYFGNLITPANWRNVWIAEGFATYVERHNQGVFGNEYMYIDRIDGNFTMVEDMKDLPHGMADTFASLYPENTDTRPVDLAFTKVPYEKGYQFLVYLEEVFGLGNMKAILKDYVLQDELSQMDWRGFQEFVNNYIETKMPSFIEDGENIDWEGWMTQSGLPPKDTIKDFESEEYDAVFALANKFLQFAGTSLPSNYNDLNTKWNPIQIYTFIDFFRQKHWMVNKRTLGQLDETYNFKESEDKNTLFRWFSLSALVGYKNTDNQVAMADFLASTGRISFVVPIYESLMESGQSGSAQSYYNQNKDWYHPETSALIEIVIYGEENNKNKLKKQQEEL